MLDEKRRVRNVGEGIVYKNEDIYVCIREV